MRRILFVSLALLSAAPSAVTASPPPSQRSPNGAAYEAEEIGIVRSVIGRVRRMPGGQPLCVNLRLLRQLPSSVSDARISARRAREAGEPGFQRIERALGRRGARAGTTDRDLDGRELAGAAGLEGSTLAEHCPAGLRLVFLRPVQSHDAAIVEAQLGDSCSSGLLSVGLRKRGRTWLVEGEYIQWMSGPPGCGQAYRAAEAPAGHYLLVGG